MKTNKILLAGQVSFGLLMIGAGSAFARGYFSAGIPGGLRSTASYHLARARSDQAWARDNGWASYENIADVDDK